MATTSSIFAHRQPTRQNKISKILTCISSKTHLFLPVFSLLLHVVLAVARPSSSLAYRKNLSLSLSACELRVLVLLLLLFSLPVCCGWGKARPPVISGGGWTCLWMCRSGGGCRHGDVRVRGRAGGEEVCLGDLPRRRRLHPPPPPRDVSSPDALPSAALPCGSSPAGSNPARRLRHLVWRHQILLGDAHEKLKWCNALGAAKRAEGRKRGGRGSERRRRGRRGVMWQIHGSYHVGQNHYSLD